VTRALEPYLPVPVVARDGRGETASYRWDFDRPLSIGRVHSYYGNIGVLIRAYAYIMSHGPDIRRVAEVAVLNANYLLSRVKHILPVPQGDRCMHEFVASAAQLKKDKGITAMDLAKRLLDFATAGFWISCANGLFPADGSGMPDDGTDGDGEQGNTGFVRGDFVSYHGGIGRDAARSAPFDVDQPAR
jgi:glycine cleavage system protein P-like pyridoxal-binding family